MRNGYSAHIVGCPPFAVTDVYIYIYIYPVVFSCFTQKISRNCFMLELSIIHAVRLACARKMLEAFLCELKVFALTPSTLSRRVRSVRSACIECPRSKGIVSVFPL